jgi:hypothetical protein
MSLKVQGTLSSSTIPQATLTPFTPIFPKDMWLSGKG